MAFEKLSKNKVISTNLDAYIASQLSLISAQRTRFNLEEESKFQKAVLDDNLTLEQQLSYRREQLTGLVDKDERRRIREAISTIKNQIEQKQFTDAYIEEVNKLNDGTQSVESTLSWLQTKLAATTDQAVIEKIKNNISTMKAKQYEIQQTTLTNATNYANNSKSQDVVSKQIDKVNTARTKALLAGNDNYVSVLDLQLQSLNKSLNENATTDNLLKMANNAILGQSALATLNTYNKYVSDADTKTPVTIGGVRYDSAQSFWNSKQTEFLNDKSANGFFVRYKTELTDKIDYKTTKGILTTASLADVKSWYEYIKARPELKDFQEKVDQDQLSSIKAAADNRAIAILNEYTVKSDAKKAISDLATIQDTYGVDMTTNYQKVVANAAKDKEDQVSQIVGTMNEILTKNPGMSNSAALSQAIKSGAGAKFSAEEYATKSAQDIINAGPKKAEDLAANKGINAPVSPTEEAKVFTTPQYKEGELYKTKNDATVYKYENGKLRAYSGNWTEDQFKQANSGKGFSAVKTIENTTGVAQGDIITPAAVATPPVNSPNTAMGDKIVDPGLLQHYKPEEVVTKGTDKYLKSGVKSVAGKLIGSTEFAQMQKQNDPATLEKKIVRAGTNIYLRQ